mmetsp:Transcript_22735/g.34699  ORF Transcript_22735/g.34699 Transcript_22735/m.34699 type:complete len:512 (+) Transcript_22735:387-1922(+)
MSNHSYDESLYHQSSQRMIQGRPLPHPNHHTSQGRRRLPNHNIPLASAAMSSMGRSPSIVSSVAVPIVVAVHVHDVLSGRGVNIASHPGNERFRSLVTSYADHSYCTSYSVSEKKAIAMQVIRHIKALNPPGRFLKREGRGSTSRGLDGPWFELSERESIKKACQALRDCNRHDRSGYAGGVAPPEDVKEVIEKASKAGLTAKDRAAQAAKDVGFTQKLPDHMIESVKSSSDSSCNKRSRDEINTEYYASLQQPQTNNDIIAPSITSSMSVQGLEIDANPPIQGATPSPISQNPNQVSYQNSVKPQYYINPMSSRNMGPPTFTTEYYPSIPNQSVAQSGFYPNSRSSYGYSNQRASYTAYGHTNNMNYPVPVQAHDTHHQFNQVFAPSNYQPPMQDPLLQNQSRGFDCNISSDPLPDAFEGGDWLKRMRTDESGTTTEESSPSNASQSLNSSSAAPRDDLAPTLFSIKENAIDEEISDNPDNSWARAPDHLNNLNDGLGDNLGTFEAGIFD